MERISFVFTVCFVLLGPVKIIPAFGSLTRGEDSAFSRRLAVYGVLLAAGACLFVLLLGDWLVRKYQLSLAALELGGGLVLLLSALRTFFPRREPKVEERERPTALQLATAPLAVPTIVTPAGVAALLIFMMLESKYPGINRALLIVLPIILALDFLVMILNRPLLRFPGLLPALQVFGFVLAFMQLSLGIDTMLDGLRALGALA